MVLSAQVKITVAQAMKDYDHRRFGVGICRTTEFPLKSAEGGVPR